MLTLLKQLTGSWIAKIFILLIVLSFGVWGISGILISGSPDIAITVGKTNISTREYLQAYEQVKNTLSQQRKKPLSNEEILTFGIKESIITRLANTAILNEKARIMGLGISDKNLAGLIGKNKAFQDVSGNFDRSVLRQRLRQLGISESDYIKSLREEALRDQLVKSVSDNTVPTRIYIDAHEEYLNEKRVFEYVVLSPEILEKLPLPTPQDIKAHYEKHQFRYIEPEYRKITIVKLEPEDVSNPDSVTPEEIADEYEARKTEFSTDEKRSIQQLILKNKEQGEKILERLKNGETLDAILAELGKTANDISIGEYQRKDIPDVNVATAAFSLKPNEVSDMVSGIFGPVLLRVTNIIPASVRPLAEIESELRKRVALNKASEELFGIYDRLEDARAGGVNLSEAATMVQLSARILEKISASGHSPEGSSIADFPEFSKLLGEAFATPEGVETDPVSIGNTGFIWYEVNEIFPKRQKRLEEVEEEASRNWSAEKTADEVKEIAKNLQSRLMSDEKFVSALVSVLPKKELGETQALEIEKTSELSRQQSGDSLPANAVQAGFGVAVNKTAIVTGKNGIDQIVLKVTDVVQGKDNPIGTNQPKKPDNTIGDDLLAQLINDLKQKENVIIDRNAITAAQNFIR